MTKIAIIGGTGLTSLKNLEITKRERMHTPYGDPSAPVVLGVIDGREVVFLPRHGPTHTIPPHKINYRANLHALRECGADQVIAINAVGGIRADMTPGRLIIPDQIIDYTWSRVSTYFEEGLTNVTHIDFTHPYCEALRLALITSAAEIGIDVVAEGTYGATQGPRLETIAEIDRLGRDGCDLVGMTGMPEAALARELGLCYASIAVSANMGAGRGSDEITMEEIERNLIGGMEKVRRLLEYAVTR